MELAGGFQVGIEDGTMLPEIAHPALPHTPTGRASSGGNLRSGRK